MKKIILYGDKYGEFTQKVRDWFSDRDLSYEEKDVEDPKILEELFKISGQYAIPVVAVGKKVILGFNEKELNEVLSGD